MGTRLIAPGASGRSVSRSIPDQSSLSFASMRLPSISSKPVFRGGDTLATAFFAISILAKRSCRVDSQNSRVGSPAVAAISSKKALPLSKARQPHRGLHRGNTVVRMEVRADVVQLDAMIRVTEHSPVGKRFNLQRCWVQRNCVRIKRKR
jgi:hypothetical protein